MQIDIAYCGVCHSDLHQVRSEWEGTLYPCVPGHEIVGRVSAVGAQVSGFKVADLVGIGCIVDSCKGCEDCDAGLENYCTNMVGTYNGATADTPGHTLGGYSQQIVVHERFVLRITHPETQEMLNFCATHGIVADIEMIRAEHINDTYERMLKGDVKYRFVIDNASLTD